MSSRCRFGLVFTVCLVGCAILPSPRQWQLPWQLSLYGRPEDYFLGDCIWLKSLVPLVLPAHSHCVGDHNCSWHWRHNGRDSVSNHQPQDCLHNRSFRRRSKKTLKFRVTGLGVGNSPGTGIHRGPVNSPHKWLVTRKIFFVYGYIISQKNVYIFCRFPW